MFDRSLIHLIRYRPWRWTTPPTYDAQGNELTPGSGLQELDGVFILLSDTLADLLAANLTQAQKDELRAWIYRVTMDQAALWHVPVWAGDTGGAVFIRVPASVWNNPLGTPPLKVRNYFQQLYRAI